MKRVKSRLLAGILSVAMAFSVVAVPIEALAATDTNGHWAESTINSWINSGYISGYPDGTFRPNNAISRAEFVTIANKAFGFTSSQGISFNDVKPGYWAYSEIQKGVAAGYIQGDTIGTFRPGSAVSRQEAAVMLANLRGYASDEGAAYNYTDRWAMANWAAGAIGAVSRNGVMSGYPDGTFRPQQALTRAEAVASLQKIATSSNSFDTSINNNNYTPPVYVTPSSNNSTYNNTTSNDDTFTGTILEGTRLENRTLTKDLLIPHSVGSQNITLKNIRMKGTLYVEGGNTITLDNCNIGTVVMNKSNAVLKNNGSSDVDEVRFEEKGRIDGKGYMNVLIDDDTVSEIIIDADIDTLTLDADVDLKLYANANIDTFEITKNADTARIRIGEDAEVMEMEVYDKVRISGKGKIDTMTVYVSGVRSEIQPRRLIQQDNARKPNFNYKDDDDDDDDYDNLTLDDDDEKFDGDDEKYNRVKIAAEDVTVKNLTAYDDLTITSAAGDSTIELEGVTVKGNVYVEGGGDNSVIFDNCSISGSIYSRKSTSGRHDEAVAIKLKDTSVKGDIYVTGDTILESDEKLNKVILNKELSKTFRMDADANNLVINYNNDVQIRGSRTINAVEVVAGLTNVTITMNGGKFNTLTTRSPIKLEGTGTIDKLFTGQTNDISSGITIGSTESIEGGTQPPSSNYVITSSISGTANGTITPLGQQTVAGGATKEFNITANTGYHVASIVINGSQVNLDGKLYQTYKYTFYNVSSNHDIIVSFEAGAGTDGNGNASNGSNNGDVNTGDCKIEASINDPALGGCDNTSVIVKQGEDASITFKASEGSHVSKVVIDKGTDNEIDLKKISEGSKTYNEVTYVFKAVDKNHQIFAEFSKPVGSNDKITITSDMPNEADTSTSFRYNLETDVTYEDNSEVKSRDTDTQEKRYYCIAGETLKLSVPKFEVLNYSGDEEALKTKWIFSGVTQAIQAELTNGENGDAILETTVGSGYIVSVALQIYDTSQNDKVIVDRAAYKQIMVDVPVEGFTFAEADGNHTLTVKGNQISLTSQTFEYDPPEASSYFEQSEIIWTIDEEKTNIEEVTGQTSQKVRIEAKESNSSTKNYILFVEQKYKDETGIHTVAMPKGTVTVKATLPNGRGNLQDFTQDFTINFTNEIIPVTRLEFNPTELEKEGITTIDLPTTITTTIIPDQADNKTVEWRIVGYTAEDTKNCSSQDEFATIEKDTNKKDTKLSIKGYAGEVNLQAFIRNGVAMGTEYTTGETDVVVTVTSKEPQISAIASLANETNNATVGKKVTLSATVRNSDETPYTKITGWEKSYDQTNWEPINPTPVSNSNPNSEGYYVSEYTIVGEDLNTNNYEGKNVYFRAYITYKDDKITGETNNIICKALEPTIELTKDDTQHGQKVTGNVTSSKYIVKGKDVITLCNEAGDGSTITWAAKSVPSNLATLDANGYTLSTTGEAGEIKLTATAKAAGGDVSKDITLEIKPQYIETLTILVLDSDGGSNVTSLPNDGNEKKVYLTADFSPAYASFQEISWYKKDADLGTTENITANVAINGEYAFTPTKDVSFYAQIPFGKDGKVAAKSEEVNISLISPDTKIKVTGLDFEKLKPTLQVSENSPYSATLTVSNTSGVNISLDSVGYTQESGEPISGKLKYSIQGGSATLEGGLLTIPAKTQKLIIRFYIDDENYVDSGGTNKYEDTLTIDVTYNPTTKTGTTPSNSSANIQSPSAGEMSIDVINEDTVADENVITENTVENSVNENNTANTNTENQNNITAVTDIAFGDIRGLQAPIAPATTYNMTSSSSGNVVLYLADNTSTVNGITTHTGVKVLPENATYKNVTWKVKEGTLLAPSTVANIVNVTDIGSLNQNTNTFTVNANASGTVTLVATIANGKGQNNNFVKELTIRITAPNNASQSSVVPSDTTSSSTTSSNETSSSANMTKASARQVVSVGTTQVGTSSISSASGSQTSQSSTKNTTTSIINHSEVKIETSGQCRKNISIPLKAVSKTTQQEYTDVEWEIVDDGNTGAKISNKNRLRASKTGTVTVKATVYTPSNEKMECSTNIVISN